jgi:hypothetical protein
LSDPFAEYRAIRLICDHFNFTGDYVKYEMEWGDFWCYLAEALDAEELADYREVVLQGGKKAARKWKWATPDHAGTRPTGEGAKKSLLAFAQALTKGPLKKTGAYEEYMRATGRPVVYKTEDGKIVDENGKPIEVPKGTIFMPLKSDKVH